VTSEKGTRLVLLPSLRVALMTTTCLINNYNYARFVTEAVDSALEQTVPFDEIIVVDDGSTDDSVDLLTRRYARHRSIEIISKCNQGQLSCFNEGFTRSTGSVVFFLDADDVYEPNYLEQAQNIYRRDPHIDFLYCGHRQFGARESVQQQFSEDRDLGYSVILTAFQREWIGAPTSCLSMRRSVLEKILPLPFVDAWRSRADDCLVFGSSLAGARKYCLAQPLVRYRVHDRNQFFGRGADQLAVYRRRLAINALFEYLGRKLCFDMERLADVHHREFCTIAQPTFRQFMKYVRIGMAMRGSYVRQLGRLAEMTRHYLRPAVRPDTTACAERSGSDLDSAPLLRVFSPDDSAPHPNAKHPVPRWRGAA
jgi:glycosyltransferase involved in cell wall biosynthesis